MNYEGTPSSQATCSSRKTVTTSRLSEAEQLAVRRAQAALMELEEIITREEDEAWRHFAPAQSQDCELEFRWCVVTKAALATVNKYCDRRLSQGLRAANA